MKLRQVANRLDPISTTCHMAACLVAAVVLMTPQPATAQLMALGACMGASGCNSNDLTFTSTGLGVVDDGCVNEDDTITIYLQSVIRNDNAQDRYDVGLYYSTSGTNAQTDPQCYRALLNPVGVENDRTCDGDPLDLDLAGGAGPWLNVDGDLCGDITDSSGGTGCDANGDGEWDDTVINFDDPTQPMTFPCKLHPIQNGFLSIAVCMSWAQGADVIGVGQPKAQCSSLDHIRPGTSPKCQCDPNLPTDVPMADLGLSCTTTTPANGIASPGETVVYEVTYTNSCTCAPDGGTIEQFQCCTAAYVQIPISYDIVNGAIAPDPGGYPPITATRGTWVDNGLGTITWTPASAGPGSAGIIGPGETATLTFRYRISTSPSAGTISNTVTGEWARNSDGTPSWVSQSALDDSCPIITIDYTWATVSDLVARVDGGRAAIEWQTAAEAGTRGFHLERRDGPAREFTRVTDRLLPATGATAGGFYRFTDRGVLPGSLPVYRLLEVDAAGREHVRGEVAAAPVSLPSDPVDDAASGDFRRGRPPVAARLAGNTAPAGAEAGTTGDPWRSGASRLPEVVRARVEMTEEGLQHVSAAQIAAALRTSEARIEAAIDSGRIRLTGDAGELPWLAAADGIVFYGSPQPTPYTDRGVYWLELARGTRMASDQLPSNNTGSALTTYRDTVDVEIDRVAYPYFALSTADDFWFWAAVMSGVPDADVAEAELTLARPAADAASATLALRLRQLTDLPDAPDVRARVLVNGELVGVVESDLPGDVTLSLSVPAAILADGSNHIRVEGELGTFLLDGFSFSYDRLPVAVSDRVEVALAADSWLSVSGFTRPELLVVDITDPLQPRSIAAPAAAPDPTGGWAVVLRTARDRRLVVATAAALPEAQAVVGDRPSSLRSSGNRGDYLVIAPAPLLTAAQRLADHRAAHGWTPLVVDVQDVYDELSGGRRDPAAIAGLLQIAVSDWALPPRAVVLVGRGTIDPHDAGAHGNLLPPSLVMSIHGALPTDSLLGDVDGDGVPEIAVGRLPVVNQAELESLVDRIIAAESDPTGNWRAQIVIAADDADRAGDFDADADRLAGLVPSGVAVDEILLGLPDTPAQARSRLVRAIDQGAGLVTWIGHGGVGQFASEGVLRRSDVRRLINGERLPVVVALTCYSNYFADPDSTSLGEELVLHDGGGAAAVWSATGPSSNPRAVQMAEAFYEQLFQQHTTVVGDAIVGALAAAAAEGVPPEGFALYTLLGDPAFVMQPSDN